MAKNSKENPNQQHKDSVFTDLFQNNPENFLSLYNAIHDTDLKLQDVKIEPKRLDQSLYHTTHNDVSMMINGKWIILIEHQSTINENMPVRLLDYVSKIYEKLIPEKDRYRKNIFFLPEPEFYVFYNGRQPYPDERVLRLSDAYITHTHKSMLELEVTVFNIYKPTAERCLKILNKCDILKQYCNCIDTIRKIYNKNYPETFDKAILECKRKGFLGEYLNQASKGRFNMLFCEYDYETDISVQRQESFEAGQKAGQKTGEIIGIQKGSTQAHLSDAVIAVREFNLEPELVSQKFNISLSELLTALGQTDSN